MTVFMPLRSSPCGDWCPAQKHKASSPHLKCLATSLSDMGSHGEEKDESPCVNKNDFMTA